MRGAGNPPLARPSTQREVRHRKRFGKWVPTSQHQEAGSLWNRNRGLSTRWWREAIALAHNDRAQSSDLLVHTNFPPWAQSIGLNGTIHGQTTIHGPDVPLLHVLRDLIFCCGALVVGFSALSSVAAMASMAERVVAPERADKHLPFEYDIALPPFEDRWRATNATAGNGNWQLRRYDGVPLTCERWLRDVVPACSV
jgi:hypothetical protein